MALALLTSGTDGEVLDELSALLGEEDAEYLSEQMGKLFRLLYSNNDVSKLYMANSLWVNEEYPVKKEYTDNAMENFYAAVNNIDFSDPEAGGMISQWISENTQGLLEPQISVNPEFVMYIVNTIYLNDEWGRSNLKKGATQQDVFYLDDGHSVDAQFYEQAVWYRYRTGRRVHGSKPWHEKHGQDDIRAAG